MEIYIVISFSYTKNTKEDEYFKTAPCCDLCIDKSELVGVFFNKAEAQKKLIEVCADCPAPPQSRGKIYSIKLEI